VSSAWATQWDPVLNNNSKKKMVDTFDSITLDNVFIF
jgi:hypothetical protein